MVVREHGEVLVDPVRPQLADRRGRARSAARAVAVSAGVPYATSWISACAKSSSSGRPSGSSRCRRRSSSTAGPGSASVSRSSSVCREPPPEDRGRGQRLTRRGLEEVEAREDHLLDRRRELDPHRRIEESSPRRRPATSIDGELADEERVPAGRLDDAAAERDRHRPLAEQGRASARLRSRERADGARSSRSHPGGSDEASRPSHPAPPRQVRTKSTGAPADARISRSIAWSARRVGPVHVLDRQHDAARARQPAHEAGQRVERPELHGLGRRLPLPVVGGAEDRAEVRRQFAGLLARPPPRVAPGGRPGGSARPVGRRARRGPARGSGGTALTRRTTGIVPRATGRPRATATPSAHLLHEPGLADPRLPLDDEQASVAGERAVGDRRALASSASRPTSGAPTSSRPARTGAELEDLERGDGLGLALQLEAPLLPPGEHVTDAALRRGADEDPARSGVGLQTRGDVDRVTGRPVLDPRARADRPEHHQPGLDADPNREAGRVGAAADGPRRSAAPPARRAPRRPRASPGRRTARGRPSPARSLTVPPNRSTASTM